MDILDEANEVIKRVWIEPDLRMKLEEVITLACANAVILGIEEDDKPLEAAFPDGTRRFFAEFEHPLGESHVCWHYEIIYQYQDRFIIISPQEMASMSFVKLIRLLTNG